ncbi:HNH endonuclease family protein [Glutamicibacter sp. NPDC087344]|uniref:HNH endonuclease family protein n=1 Tax=Glutamicibacter sp. NPDC087344 TaxID=3363994 RepID=UPI003814FA6E
MSQLAVKGKAPMTGYDRNDKFGNGWKDPDGNKCDARQDILTRDMTNVVYKDSLQCTVASGTLNDLYTGKSINWKVKAGSVDIDHAVALGNVWISGGQQLSQDQRVAVANDPLNLIASDASANRAKGDENAAEWLPPNKAFRCQYVATQISVKHKYALSVTAPEKAAMAKVLDTCPAQLAAEVTPIKPAGQSKAKTEAPAEEKKVDTAAKEPAATQLVHPGAFCSDAGATGTGKKNGKPYTCKASDTEDRLRWRA